MIARRTRVVRLLTALIAALRGAQTLRAADAEDPRRKEITQTADAFIAAFHKGDAAALASFWTPDGDYIDISGRVLQGRAAIEKDFAEQFGMVKGLTLRIEVNAIRFPTPDTAVEDGVTSVISPDNVLPTRTRYTNFFVKSGGKWLLSSVRESPYSPPGHYEQLRPLEWMIGEWQEETTEGIVSRVVFEWSPDENYIIATRAVEADGALLVNGSQRIGWDPVAKVLRTWTFEADGSFSEGAWEQADNHWINKVNTVLRSGSMMTASHIVTRVDPNTITVQSKNQQVDGNPLPDTIPITMKRVR
jgi:uncharacterized protein (TIGR02246 family)